LPHIADRAIPEKSSAQVSTLTELVKSCVELMKDINMLCMLYNMIDHYTKGRDIPFTERMVNQVLHRKRMNEEFRFNAQIGEYNVDDVILDLGYDVNVVPKHTW
jgi:hypothetical protein